MNRIDELFKKKKERILSIYMTAGFPTLDSTIQIIKSLESAGADMVEIGMPFSDPLADGPVIQESSQIALSNGMTINALFGQLKNLRNEVSIPVILMGYLNPVLQYGMDLFLNKCSEVGVDGVIVPDLPLREFNEEFRKDFSEAGIAFSMLITPQTSEERVRAIAESTSGFLYMVSDSSTTGAKGELKDRQIDYFNRINSMELDVPRLIGFGISNAKTFSLACSYAQGAIVGSAFISAIKEVPVPDLDEAIREFLQEEILA